MEERDLAQIQGVLSVLIRNKINISAHREQCLTALSLHQFEVLVTIYWMVNL